MVSTMTISESANAPKTAAPAPSTPVARSDPELFRNDCSLSCRPNCSFSRPMKDCLSCASCR